MNYLLIDTSKGKKRIGFGWPVFVVAEMSANHNQKIEEAFKIIDAAAFAGADAVKLQTYTSDTLTIDSDKEWFRIETDNAWQGQTLYSLYQKAYMPWQWQPELKHYGEKKGLVVFSAPFDETAVDFLEKHNFPMYKVGSPEIVDTLLLKKIGKTKKPVILSSGMASVEEIELALAVLEKNGCSQTAILHCLSSYPARPENMNLTTMSDIRQRFGRVTGLSDHSLSVMPPVIASALGAKIIEKHLCLKRTGRGIDDAFSLEPEEFKLMVNRIRKTEKILGRITYGVSPSEKDMICFRRSLFAVKDIKKWQFFTQENVRSIRPGYGLAPKYYDKVIGKRARDNIAKGTPLQWDLIE